MLPDATGRLRGHEGGPRLHVVVPDSDGKVRAQPLAPTMGSAEPQLLPIHFDECSQAVLPWKKPTNDSVHSLLVGLQREFALVSELFQLAPQCKAGMPLEALQAIRLPMDQASVESPALNVYLQSAKEALAQMERLCVQALLVEEEVSVHAALVNEAPRLIADQQALVRKRKSVAKQERHAAHIEELEATRAELEQQQATFRRSYSATTAEFEEGELSVSAQQTLDDVVATLRVRLIDLCLLKESVGSSNVHDSVAARLNELTCEIQQLRNEPAVTLQRSRSGLERTILDGTEVCDVVDQLGYERSTLDSEQHSLEQERATLKKVAYKYASGSERTYVAAKLGFCERRLQLLGTALKLVDDEIHLMEEARKLTDEQTSLEHQRMGVLNSKAGHASMLRSSLTVGENRWKGAVAKVLATIGNQQAERKPVSSPMEVLLQQIEAHWASKQRNLGVMGLRRYGAGQQLCVCHTESQQWADAVVLQPHEERWSAMHTLRNETDGSTFSLSLTPFNHTPREMPLHIFNSLWKRHCRTMRAQHASITDALSGRRLDTLAHCVPIEMARASHSITHEGSKKEAGKNTDVHDAEGLIKWLRGKHEQRCRKDDDVVDAVCVLVTAGPAAGKTCLMSQLVMYVVASDSGAVDIAPGVYDLLPIFIRVQDLQKRLLDQEDAFATSWNWVDAYLCIVHGGNSELYQFLRQALKARRALLLLDGIDEAGRARNRIEDHLTGVLAAQGHAMILTSRPNGVREELFHRKHLKFNRLELRPLTDAQQTQVVSARISASQGENYTQRIMTSQLMDYIRTQVPKDTETKVSVTGNPLMLSMVLSIYESRRAATNDKEMTGPLDMPRSVTELYRVASTAMLDRLERKERGDGSSSADNQHMRNLLQAIFFQAHASERRIIRETDLETATLGLTRPDELRQIQAHTTLGKARKDAIHEAYMELPQSRRAAAQSIFERVRQDRLPVMSLIQVAPLEIQSSHLSFQEYFTARAIVDELRLPPEAEEPWRWPAWWANTLKLGGELGEPFIKGLLKASKLAGHTALDLRSEVGRPSVGGDRQTSFAAIALLMRVVTSIECAGLCVAQHLPLLCMLRAPQTPYCTRSLLPTLPTSLRDNRIYDIELEKIAQALTQGGSSLTTLNLAGNRISHYGVHRLSEALEQSAVLTKGITALDLSRNDIAGAFDQGLTAALAKSKIRIVK